MVNDKSGNTANQGKKAQGLMEFALAIPFLMVMLIGIIEAAWMMFFFTSASMSSREAARYGAAVGLSSDGLLRYRDCAGIRTEARRVGAFASLTNNSQIQIFFDDGPGTPQVEYCNPNPIPDVKNGERIIVKVVGHYKPLINLIIIPPFDFKSEFAYTIMSKIKIYDQ